MLSLVIDKMLRDPLRRECSLAFRQPLIELAMLLVGAAIGRHHLGPHHTLRGNDVVQIVFESPLQHKPLRLSILLGNGDELGVELGVDFGSDFDGARRGCLQRVILTAERTSDVNGRNSSRHPGCRR